jgi:hypothetical protein
MYELLSTQLEKALYIVFDRLWHSITVFQGQMGLYATSMVPAQSGPRNYVNGCLSLQHPPDIDNSVTVLEQPTANGTCISNRINGSHIVEFSKVDGAN